MFMVDQTGGVGKDMFMVDQTGGVGKDTKTCSW